ncbi:Hypothetical protein MSYG_2451 [Malassezia sympodialis ATCC 42132]|uniref:Uncharacterized protein n=1 Tax=Malassezia sympodialis (strain ATCC 42132) TaxID=1230383 RepID=A0A1M8A6U3_MALS4|nr:Hypothetical protein MSYG_2451 [Malassezia sympodialis ATCC 42132]
MSERRVDKSDPRMVAAIRPLTIPKAWEEEQRVSIYETMLSSMSLMTSMAVISPYPDLTALGLLFSGALVMNLKPHSKRKESSDLNTNAYTSYFFAALVTVFLALRKLLVT